MYIEQGNKTLHTKNRSKRTSVTIHRNVDVKSEVRDPKRLTSYNKNIANARLDIYEACCKCKGNGVPNTNSDRTTTPPKSGFSKGDTTKICGDCDSQPLIAAFLICSIGNMRYGILYLSLLL